MREIALIFRRQGLIGQFEEHEPLLVWDHVIGPNMSQMTNAVRVREGILYIQVQNNVVAQQLDLLKDKVLKKLNENLHSCEIKDLRFRVGKVEREVSNEHSPVDLLDLSQTDLDPVLDEIEDETLKESLLARLQYNHVMNERRKAEGYKECSGCGAFHEESGDICYHSPLSTLQ